MNNNIYFVRIKQSDKSFEDWLCVVSGCNFGFASLQGCSLFENTFPEKDPILGVSVEIVPESDYSKMKEAIECCGFHTTNDARRILEVSEIRSTKHVEFEIKCETGPLLLPYILNKGDRVIATKAPGSRDYFAEVTCVGGGKTNLSIDYMRELGYRLRRVS